MCADRTPTVRAAFHAALARWMTTKGRHAALDAAGAAAEAAEAAAAAAAGGEGGDVEMSEGGGGGGGGTQGNGDATGPMVGAPAGLGGPPPEGCALRHAPVLLPMLLTGVSDETDANGGGGEGG